MLSNFRISKLVVTFMIPRTDGSWRWTRNKLGSNHNEPGIVETKMTGAFFHGDIQDYLTTLMSIFRLVI